MDIYIYIGIAVAAVILVFLILKRGKKALRTAELFKKAKQIQTTPNGIKIYGERCSDQELQAFDTGARRAFEIAVQCKNYTQKLSHSDWSIFVLPSKLSPEQRVPSYFYPYPNDPDKSVMIIAGEFVLINDSTVIAVAQPQGQLSFAEEVVYNELEHGIDAWNNHIEYMRWATPGHVHPLWTDCRTNSLARSISKQKCGCSFSNLRQFRR